MGCKRQIVRCAGKRKRVYTRFVRGTQHIGKREVHVPSLVVLHKKQQVEYIYFNAVRDLAFATFVNCRVHTVSASS